MSEKSFGAFRHGLMLLLVFLFIKICYMSGGCSSKYNMSYKTVY